MDPCIPFEDGSSPFLDSSNDVVDLLFRRLSVFGEQYKMRLELVCRRFQYRITQRSSWHGENLLILGPNYNYVDKILINKTPFSLEKACSALAKLLDRITAEEFISNFIGNNIPMDNILALCHTIAQHKDFINLKTIQVVGPYENENEIITAIVDCGLENVVQLELLYLFDPFPPIVHCILFHCRNLKMIDVSIHSLPMLEILLNGLANCHRITHVKLTVDGTMHNFTHQHAIEFGEFCSSNFPKLTALEFCPFTTTPFQPVEFYNSLSETICSNMTCFGITLDVTYSSHHDFLTTISNRFPKLDTLAVFCRLNFPITTLLLEIFLQIMVVRELRFTNLNLILETLQAMQVNFLLNWPRKGGMTTTEW